MKAHKHCNSQPFVSPDAQRRARAFSFDSIAFPQQVYIENEVAAPQDG
jgi:hypothetical protein